MPCAIIDKDLVFAWKRSRSLEFAFFVGFFREDFFTCLVFNRYKGTGSRAVIVEKNFDMNLVVFEADFHPHCMG